MNIIHQMGIMLNIILINKILIKSNDDVPNVRNIQGCVLHRAHRRTIYRLKTERHLRFGSRISITYFELKRLEMHSWLPYAKHPTFEFGQQGDGDGKFKVGIGERGATIEVQGTKVTGAAGRLHLALNSDHDGWFPDVIQWSCAAPTRRLMKTHASSGASQMIPRPCIRSACRRVRFRSIVHANGVPSITRAQLRSAKISKVARHRDTAAVVIRKNRLYYIFCQLSRNNIQRIRVQNG